MHFSHHVSDFLCSSVEPPTAFPAVKNILLQKDCCVAECVKTAATENRPIQISVKLNPDFL